MALGPTKEDTLGMSGASQRAFEERQAELIRASALVNELEHYGGRRTGSIPWHDEIFQAAVLKRLSEIPRLRQAAEKLAIVKEVFGSK